MRIKWVGAILIFVSCGGFGFLTASAYKRQEASLLQLCKILEYMAWELEYRLTPLPELCANVSRQSKSTLGSVFSLLARELEGQIAPDVEHCVTAVLKKTQDLPSLTVTAMTQLGASLGQYDLSGQLKGLEAVGKYCSHELQRLGVRREERLRGYQTLGLCAGAALAILFI